jgi:hypothetical protein
MIPESMYRHVLLMRTHATVTVHIDIYTVDASRINCLLLAGRRADRSIGRATISCRCPDNEPDSMDCMGMSTARPAPRSEDRQSSFFQCMLLSPLHSEDELVSISDSTCAPTSGKRRIRFSVSEIRGNDRSSIDHLSCMMICFDTY